MVSGLRMNDGEFSIVMALSCLQSLGFGGTLRSKNKLEIDCFYLLNSNLRSLTCNLILKQTIKEFRFFTVRILN